MTKAGPGQGNPSQQGPNPGHQPPAQTPTLSPAELAMVRWTRAVALFTGLLFVANAISDGVIFFQLKDARDAQNLTQEQLRASVNLTGISQGPSVDSVTGKPTHAFVVTFQNTGGTRTAWARGWVSANYFPDKVPVNLDLSKPYDELSSPMSNGVVGPNGFLLIPVGMHPEETKLAADGKGAIILWGRLEYATIYNPTASIENGICFLMTPI